MSGLALKYRSFTSLLNSFSSAGKAGNAKAAREAGIVTYCKTDKADWSLENSAIVFTQKH